MNIVNIDKLSNKIIYLAPYNKPTNILYKGLQKISTTILGFIDSNKTGDYIIDKLNMKNYDYILISSPNYWHEIAQLFPEKKVLLIRNNKLITLYNYKNELEKNYKIKEDIIFYPHNKSHIADMLPIIDELNQLDKDVLVLESDLNTSLLSKIRNINKINVDAIFLDILSSYKCFICFNDWDTLSILIIKRAKIKNKITVGIVEGITDFQDSDYSFRRNAYERVQYVFATGRNDLKYLSNKKIFIVGIPKMIPLLKEKISFPNNPLIVINLSFVALTYNDESIFWLQDVVSVCNKLKLEYIISQHPSDKTNLINYNITNKTIYEVIKSGTLLISRFSTTILESIALGKPAVYYKPKQETITLYDNNNNSFSIATNKNELKEKIIYELNNKNTVRERSNQFLDNQCNINTKEKPEILATRYIIEILKQHQ